MGKIILVILTAALGIWMIYIALQIKQGGKPQYGSIGQRIRYEDAASQTLFLKKTRRYHLIIGLGFVGVALAAWLISKPVVVLFLYLIYAAGINFARAHIENQLLETDIDTEARS